MNSKNIYGFAEFLLACMHRINKALHCLLLTYNCQRPLVNNKHMRYIWPMSSLYQRPRSDSTENFRMGFVGEEFSFFVVVRSSGKGPLEVVCGTVWWWKSPLSPDISVKFNVLPVLNDSLMLSWKIASTSGAFTWISLNFRFCEEISRNGTLRLS